MAMVPVTLYVGDTSTMFHKSSDIEQVNYCVKVQGIDGSDQVIADINQYLVDKREPY